MGIKEVRHLKKCIRAHLRELQSKLLNDDLNTAGEIESLKRHCGWVYNDSDKLLKEWDKKWMKTKKTIKCN